MTNFKFTGGKLNSYKVKHPQLMQVWLCTHSFVVLLFLENSCRIPQTPYLPVTHYMYTGQGDMEYSGTSENGLPLLRKPPQCGQGSAVPNCIALYYSCYKETSEIRTLLQGPAASLFQRLHCICKGYVGEWYTSLCPGTGDCSGLSSSSL